MRITGSEVLHGAKQAPVQRRGDVEAVLRLLRGAPPDLVQELHTSLDGLRAKYPSQFKFHGKGGPLAAAEAGAATSAGETDEAGQAAAEEVEGQSDADESDPSRVRPIGELVAHLAPVGASLFYPAQPEELPSVETIGLALELFLLNARRWLEDVRAGILALAVCDEFGGDDDRAERQVALDRVGALEDAIDDFEEGWRRWARAIHYGFGSIVELRGPAFDQVQQLAAYRKSPLWRRDTRGIVELALAALASDPNARARIEELDDDEPGRRPARPARAGEKEGGTK